MGTPLRTWLYRRAGWAVICLAALLVPNIHAQYARKNTQSKGPRALGLLELYPSGQARLRPICIMIDGRFYDASVYKADPVPMALDSGIVYEGLRAGESRGLFTIKNVLQNQARKTFAAEGAWMPAEAAPPKSTAMKAEPKPREEEDDKPPVLRRPGSEPPKTDNPAANTKPAEQKPAESQPKQDEDTDRPILKKPASEPTPATPAPQAAPQTNSDEADPNRPHLRRGGPEPSSKSSPAQPAPSTPGKHPSAIPKVAMNETQLLPAISDAGGPEPRPYTYDMTPKEEQGFRTKVLGLAAQQLLKQARQLEPEITPAPAQRSVRTGKASSKSLPEPVWDDVQLKIFDVATSNEPILVLTAKAHLPERAKPATSGTAPTEFYVTVVAHSDLYGELRSLFTAVTDDRTLDVTPKYQIIDVVDADGDGRGELLFRRTSDQGSSFVVYRVGADQLWPLFEGTPQ